MALLDSKISRSFWMHLLYGGYDALFAQMLSIHDSLTKSRPDIAPRFVKLLDAQDPSSSILYASISSSHPSICHLLVQYIKDIGQICTQNELIVYLLCAINSKRYDHELVTWLVDQIDFSQYDPNKRLLSRAIVHNYSSLVDQIFPKMVIDGHCYGEHCEAIYKESAFVS